MSIAVYLANQTVQVAVGSLGPHGLTIRHVYEMQAPEGSIINGVVTDEELFQQSLASFWKQYRLPTTSVKIVINSSQLVAKNIEVPKQSSKKLAQYIKRELTNVERTENPVYGFMTLSDNKERKTKSVIATMAERDFVGTYERIFQRIGINPSIIESATVCAVKSCLKLFEHKENTIVQLLDGMMLESILFVDGMYYYSSSNRIFSEPSTTQFAMEIARSTSHMLQFMNSQQLSTKNVSVHMTGFSYENYFMCVDSIEQLNPGVKVSDIHSKNSGIAFLNPGEPGSSLHQCFYSIGGLWQEKNLNLLSDYLKPVNEKTEKKGVLEFLPLILTTGACILAVAIAGGIHLYNKHELSDLKDYNQQTEIQNGVKEYDALNQEISELREKSEVLASLDEDINSYPKMNSSVEKVIQSCADKIADVSVDSYDSVTGAVTIQATAKEVSSINEFIDHLRKESIFENIDYKGYTYVDVSKVWNINVTCYLSEKAGK